MILRKRDMIFHHKDGEFDFMVNSPVYHILSSESGTFRNKLTGETVGNVVYLRVKCCDDNGYPLLVYQFEQESDYELLC